MKKALFALLFLPSLAFADRLGSLKPNSDVALSTQAILNQSALQTGAKFHISSGSVDGQFQTQGDVLMGGITGSSLFGYPLRVLTAGVASLGIGGGGVAVQDASFSFYTSGVDVLDSTNGTSLQSNVPWKFAGYDCSGNTNGGKLTADGSGLVSCADDVSGGGGSSASTLAVTTGTASAFSSIASSPTAIIVLDQANFAASLTGGATGFISLRAAITSVSANYAVTSTDTIVLADASGGSNTVTLPTAVGLKGKIITVKRTSSGANTVTIATTSSQTIDGALTQVLTTQYTSVDLISDGSNWGIL